MQKFILYAFLFFLVNGCLEQLDIPVITNEPVMVVDGLLTDQPGPYTVKLFWSSPLNKDLDHPNPVAGATVSIWDDQGVSETLHERIPGTYETTEGGIQGAPGRQYQLRITTTDGRQYESATSTLEPVPDIEELSFHFRENVINLNDAGRPHDAFAILVKANALDGASNLLRWRWTGIYHVTTFPQLKQKSVLIDDMPTLVPDPLPCSGYITNEQHDLIYVKPCECCDCYVTEYSNEALISANAFSAGESFNNIQVAQIPADNWRFMDRYYMEVEQMSVSEPVYDFWKLVETQQKGTGDIFQPNVVKIRGNMRSVTNPHEEVFGIFSVSAMAKKSMFIQRNDIPKRVPQIDTLRGDCRHAFFNSTTDKPPFW